MLNHGRLTIFIEIKGEIIWCKKKGK